MNWISNVVRPKIRSILRREAPGNLWIKCPETGQLVFYKDVEANQFVIPGSNYHMRMGALARLKSIFDNETWFDVALPEVQADPLKFRDERKYVDRVRDARARTGLNDAVKVGYGKLEGSADKQYHQKAEQSHHHLLVGWTPPTICRGCRTRMDAHPTSHPAPRARHRGSSAARPPAAPLPPAATASAADTTARPA
jgi:hypothetical protein